MTLKEIVSCLDLKPHPEGGFYRELYRSSGSIPHHALPSEFSGPRNFATSIYFLITSASFSAFHRIKQDEVWHFYLGSPLVVHTLNADRVYTKYTVGQNLKAGERPQVVIPAGCWFAASVVNPDSYSLIGCSVSPGFDFDDFELAKREHLVKQFPDHEPLIREFTR